MTLQLKMAKNNQGDKIAVSHHHGCFYISLNIHLHAHIKKQWKQWNIVKYIHGLYTEDTWNLTKQIYTKSCFISKPIRLPIETSRCKMSTRDIW